MNTTVTRTLIAAATMIAAVAMLQLRPADSPPFAKAAGLKGASIGAGATPSAQPSFLMSGTPRPAEKTASLVAETPDEVTSTH